MAKYNHSFENYNQEKMARAVGRDLGISTKQSIEICSTIRNKGITAAKRILEKAIELKEPIEYKRFRNGIGHKRGHMASGAFPVKASTAILKVINNAEANAQEKGLNSELLKIVHVCAHKASTPMHGGRQRRSVFKRSHVEIVLAEVSKKKKLSEKKVEEAKPATPKVEEAKPETPKEEQK